MSVLKRMCRVCGAVLALMVLGPVAVQAQVPAAGQGRTITGTVQNQDLRRVPQATVEVKDQEGVLVGTGVATMRENLPWRCRNLGPTP